MCLLEDLVWVCVLVRARVCRCMRISNTPTGPLLCQCSVIISLYLSADPSPPLSLPCCYHSLYPPHTHPSFLHPFFTLLHPHNPTLHKHTTHADVVQIVVCVCVLESIQPLPFRSYKLHWPLTLHWAASVSHSTTAVCHITPSLSLWLHLSLGHHFHLSASLILLQIWFLSSPFPRPAFALSPTPSVVCID